MDWIGLGSSIFSEKCNSIESNGKICVAVGSGTNSLAYSLDGIYNWTGVDQIFATGNKVSYNGYIWIAVGYGSNTIAWSNDGIVWRGLGLSVFSYQATTIEWNGIYWIASGTDLVSNNDNHFLHSIAYSTNGIDWNKITNNFSIVCNHISWNKCKEGIYINHPSNKLYLSNNNNTIQLITDNYYQYGCKTISININSNLYQ